MVFIYVSGDTALDDDGADKDDEDKCIAHQKCTKGWKDVVVKDFRRENLMALTQLGAPQGCCRHEGAEDRYNCKI